ncbi:PAS domain-containing hybrid sensor histidine kinase/response regulator [Azospirillum picis]|uniref:histidine kinase n=1 Tax=Azospirillum picis TaxID=488438 RepID=A0ABU0MUE7_9PROT|nr:PAS domain-containing protein [Azospirillum picis]MBP2302949.1 PAS domain S-box-containing protein [Azospirillum picis]MDQ0536701.1 PAS domain S-box-containing protein [Azospirillum picis]
MTDPQLVQTGPAESSKRGEPARGGGDLRTRLEALELENARLRTALSDACPGHDDLLTVTALNEDLRAACEALERSRAAHADSERRLRAILDSAVGHAIVTLDSDGRVTSWNPGATRLLGWTEEEARGRGVAFLFPSEDAAAGASDALRALALEDGQIDGERAFRRRDGRDMWGAFTILPLQGGDGGFLWILHDRSDERRVEDAIADARRRASDILNSIDEAMVALDRDYRVICQNRRAEELVRRPLSELRGRQLWEVWPQLVGSDVEAACRGTMADRVPACMEKRFDGENSTLWLEIRFLPTPEGVGCFFRDITTRKRAEEEARASHERTVTILESISDAFYAVDHDWRFTYINRKAEQVWKRSRDTLLGRRIWEAFPEVVGSEAFEAQKQALREGREMTVEVLSPILGDWVEISIYPSTDGLSVYFRDITARRQAQQALMQAKEAAEAADLAKGKFLAAASHDLRQPLQALLFFVDVLKPHVQGSQGANALMHLGRGLDALKELLDSLLDMSRLDAGVVQPNIETVPIGPLFEHIGASYRPVAAAKGLEFRVMPCDAAALSDRTLVTRMVRNLVENALRYTETGRIDLECRQAGGGLLIEVRDTGIGIPPDHLERIWEEFHQVGNPERDRNRGLGLGLAIVRRLSQLLDHPVQVRSTPGVGTSFVIALPLGRGVERPSGPAEQATAGRGRFAVVVDDDAIVLLGLETIFRDWGYEVLVAGSADKAVEALRRSGRRPDLVVADYRLREGRIGTEAVARIRELFDAPGQPPVPGLILTGETGPECERDAAAHGLGIIHKPVTPRQLGHALGDLLGVA